MHKSPTIALVTFSEPQPAKTESLLIEPLARRGIEAHIVAWDDIHTDWTRFDGMVICSTWDYHHRMREFRTWLNFLISQGKFIMNHIDVLRWSMDKIYLRTLADAGINTLDSVFLTEHQATDLTRLMESRGWKRAIIKPTISGGGDNTYLVTLDEAEAFQADFDKLLAKHALIVQAYAPEIQQGEISFVFFNGLYSHAALKRPAPDSIFVHLDRGGTAQHHHPAPALIAQASLCLRVAEDIIKQRTVYARIDGILRDDRLLVMEVELVEPELFLHMDADASERFADAIMRGL